jgi:hypothetical protein
VASRLTRPRLWLAHSCRFASGTSKTCAEKTNYRFLRTQQIAPSSEMMLLRWSLLLLLLPGWLW